ncbi:unnamed protein product [Pseudo-nitzschia multistriata]|uniref:AB hydrolase-1 domain-containing protein n=1 Tax=Pseudo-nitzschia multistriata TaxID=183589 RepID=A0A448Z333_9STRA|nr:unnamed protein product [Pseudo-nitzschia multistriata]
MKLPVTHRGMIQTALGAVFYLISDGRSATDTAANEHRRPPVLCFHMSPRSSDEFSEVLPLLASGGAGAGSSNEGGRAVIAFDIPGYGASENPPRSCTIDELSDACLQAADSILERGAALATSASDDATTTDQNQHQRGHDYVAIGSLLGNYFCLSLAARHPGAIRAGILANPWFNPGARGMTASGGNGSIPDSFVLEDDGSHLAGLHAKRSTWLDNELNLRVVRSEIEYLSNRRVRYAKGISIEGGNDYNFVAAVERIHRNKESGDDEKGRPCRFLCLKGAACATLFDAFGLDGTERFEQACRMFGSNGGLEVVTLGGERSTLNLVNQMPEEFAAACNEFLSGHGL